MAHSDHYVQTLIDRIETLERAAGDEVRGMMRDFEAETAQLHRWKAEAMEVLAAWDEVASMVPARLGESKADTVARALRNGGLATSSIQFPQSDIAQRVRAAAKGAWVAETSDMLTKAANELDRLDRAVWASVAEIARLRAEAASLRESHNG